MHREDLIAKLRAQRSLFEKERVRSVTLFGSRARGDDRADSDVDLLVDYEPDARVSLIGVCRLERILSETLGATVQVSTEPLANEKLRRNVERDRVGVL